LNKKVFCILFFIFYFFVFCFSFFCILFFIFLYFVLFTQNVLCCVVQGVWLNLNCSESDEELLELDNDPVAELE
jgi:hypothetical protein